ncbi:acyltransferase family protein [Wohlfahrtiimonas populi]|uniref:acyltransferase family protein n=1 Tax=Wohlfahrtiimonas populi TaxID=1940240 RepID=UPI00098D6759|nr:acyltransferase family protein [Wohlfahrtiimonas populi]
MQFRTDINGLRAYAVLAVIIFHFNKQWLPGGFVGVDVFFVISGYLMTSIIFRGLDTQTLSLLKFYTSRIKRIIPALLALVIILMVLGYFFLGPISYRSLSKESIRSLLFISNFLFWRESGYFDTSAISKPLLHTWSLSVEWQFYIIYPAILMLCAKIFSQSILKKLVLVIATISLAFTIYFSYQSPIAAYFLLPTRIWEMLLGGIIFLYPLKLTKSWHQYSLEIIGIALIIFSFFIINENIPWPGYMALIPTIGAFLLIQANGQSFLTNNVIFQKIGLWSYSLYLYHWPLIYINHRYNLQMHFVTFLALTFTLSLLSYYAIEIRKWKVKYILITIFVALIPIYGVYKTKGASFRVLGQYALTSEEFQKLYYGGGYFPAYQVAYTHPQPNNDFDYITIGDSYSRQYVQFLIKNHVSTQTWYADACLFTTNYTVFVNKKELSQCTSFVENFHQEMLVNKHTKPIIWIQSWDFYTLVSEDNEEELLSQEIQDTKYYAAIVASIENTIAYNKNRTIYLIGVYTRPTYDIYECLSTSQLSNFITESCDEFIPRQHNPINDYLLNVANTHKNVIFIDPNEGLCDDRGCRMLINNEPIFSDMGHLSTYGADIIGTYIFDEINKYEAQQKILKMQKHLEDQT